MTHEMKLQSSPYEKIRDGSKTIEIRLNDEKRQQLQVGDEIVFSLIDNPEQKIKTKIIELFRFPTFKELFESFSPELYGSKSKEEYLDMYKYYSSEDETKYGVLGIKLEYLGEL